MKSTIIEPVERLTCTAQEVADMLGVDHKTVRRAMEKGQIPFIPIGRLKRVPKHAIMRMLEIEGGGALGE